MQGKETEKREHRISFQFDYTLNQIKFIRNKSTIETHTLQYIFFVIYEIDLLFLFIPNSLLVDKGDCSIKTVDGRCCSIPFAYKGIKYDSCTKPDPKYQWCSLDSTYEGRWGYCGNI